MAHTTKTTHELAEGDIVNCHGMRCLIDREIKVSRSHPTNEHSPTLYTSALVLNRDEVGNVVPFRWTLQPDGEHRWQIQGNGLARWSVEKKDAEWTDDDARAAGYVDLAEMDEIRRERLS